MKNKIYVSSCGTGNAYATIKAIKENFKDLHVIGADINPSHLNASSKLCDDYIISIPIKDDKYPDFLRENFNKYKPLLFFGFIEEDIYIAEKVSRSLDVHIAAPKNVDLYINKSSYLSILKKNQILTPEFGSHPDLIGNFKKYIIKPINGCGSKGIKIIKDKPSSTNPENLIMQFVSGPEFTIDCFYDDIKGFFTSLARERIEVKEGVCTKARIFQNLEIRELCLKIAILLGLRGTFCIQVINENGKFYVVDVNPRPGSGTEMTKKTGNDFFSANVAYYLGRDYSPYFSKDLINDLHVVRVFNEIYF